MKVDKEEFSRAAEVEQTSKDDALKTNAETARVIAHNLSPVQALKVYPSAICWCFMVSMCVIMEGLIPPTLLNLTKPRKSWL